MPQKKKFRLHDLWGVLKESGSEWVEDKAPKMSGALAYYTAISIAPLIIITIKIVAIFYRDKASDVLKTQLGQLTDPQIATAMSDAIKKAGQSGSGTVATLISIVIAIFGASAVFGELQDSLNTIWEVRPKPDRGIMGMVRDRFLSMTMVFAIAFILLVSMFISTVIQGVSSGTAQGVIGQQGGTIAYILAPSLNIIISIVVVTLLFAAIFRYLPDVKIAWRDVWLGALVTSVLFEAGKFGLSIYFAKGSPTSAYGAAGSFVAFLLWVYYSAYILFFGAEFTQVYANEYGSHIVPADNAEPLTEAMRQKQGIPHADAKQTAADSQRASSDAGGEPAAPHRPRTGSRAGARRSPRPAALQPHPRLAYVPDTGRAIRSHRPTQPAPKSYAGRYVPILAAAVLARFVYKRVQEHRKLSLLPAPVRSTRLQTWAHLGRRWVNRAALKTALRLSKTRPGRAVLRAGLRAKLMQV